MRAMIGVVPSVHGVMKWNPRGMGQDDGSEGDGSGIGVDGSTLPIQPYDPSTIPCTENCATNPTYICPNGVVVYAASDCSTSSGSSSSVVSTNAVTNAINSITNAFTSIYKSIAGPLPAGCTQVSTVYGTSTQCVGANGTPTLSTAIPGLGNLSLGTVLLIGGGLVLVMMMDKK